MIGPVYSPAQLAHKLDPEGAIPITARSIRTEIASGRLKAIKIAGKLCIREQDAQDWITGGEQCREKIQDWT